MKIKRIVTFMLTMIIMLNLLTNKNQVYANKIYSTEYIKKQETQFIDNNYFGTSKKDYEYKKGNIPVLISAPHTVKQMRNGEYKKADIYTGALVKTLHDATGAHVIYKTSTNGDENYTTEDTMYRKKIKEIVENNHIKIIIDLHGMSADKDSDIDIGTGGHIHGNLLGKKNILSIVKKSLDDVNYTVNKYFAAGSNKTISSYCSSTLGIPTLQIEVNGKYRSSDSENFTYMANNLEEMINDLSNGEFKSQGIIGKIVDMIWSIIL